MSDTRPVGRGTAVGTVLAAAILLTAAVLVVFSLRRPEPPTYAPTPPAPVEVGEQRVGPVVYAVDATDSDRWRYFDFSRGSVVERPRPLEWDLAFRRFHVIANGGAGFPGAGGVLDMGAVPFDSVRSVPAHGYLGTEVDPDSINPGFGKWYDYGFTTHLLTPKGHVYAVRTADGRFAKLEILSYYCPGAQPGCITFRYVYQGDGSTRVAAPASTRSRPDPPASPDHAPAPGVPRGAPSGA
ncbi:MAG TPA: HmuY family protein [Longimicrobiales bacterium]